MTKIVIFGTGSFAELAHFYFTHDSEHEVAGFSVTRDQLGATAFCGLPVVSFDEVERHFPPQSHQMFVAVGYRRVNRVRAGKFHEALAKGYTLATYVSSRCSNWSTRIGRNCFVFEDNTIQPFVTIGDDVILWSGNHVGHHTTIGDHCFLASHVVVSGHCRIGPYCFLGVNATIRDSLTLGEATVVGAGALVMKSTEPRQVFLGERTRPFKKASDEIDF